jgi:hypothetical protein
VDKKVLIGGGKVSHEKAVQKAKSEFRKYENRQIDVVERDYLEMLKNAEKKLNDKEEK